MAIPERRVGNQEIAARLGVEPAWISKRTGTRERPWAAPDERMSEFAARAGRTALSRADVDPRELDLVLVATATADEITPNAAPLVAGLVGADRAGACDVGSACTGWLAALAMACAQIESGRANHALVVGADFLSRFLDFSDRETAPLFADGAGAAVVSATGEAPGRIGPVLLFADHAGADLIRLGRGERTRMQGQETFRAAVNRLVEAAWEALDWSGLGLPDIDLFVPHQANSRIIRAVRQRLELPGRRLRRAVR
jgi:3-oxoacyl-[acyl-carrier-protein] synthase III